LVLFIISFWVNGDFTERIKRLERPNKRFLVASLPKNSKILISRVATTFSLRRSNLLCWPVRF